MNVYPFIEAEKVEQRNVAKACELLMVSRSAFYEWSKHTPSAPEIADAELGQAGFARHPTRCMSRSIRRVIPSHER